MVVTAPPTITAGDSVLAQDLDTLLAACDDRLRGLFGDKTWFAYNTSDVPSHQIPPLGAVYVLTADADRTILPAPGTPDPAGNPFNWPERYIHADHETAADALAFVGIDSQEVAWEVSGTYSVDVYSFGDCPDILERDETDGAFSGVKPLRLSGNFEPERFHRYALADVFIEDDAAGTVSWPHDKFGVVRIHNVSRASVTVELDGAQSIEVPAWGIRVIRRTSRTGEWDTTSGRRYFPPAASGDIPMWDCDEAGAWPNWVLRSQAANPIFRQAIISSMFRPQAVTGKSPGMFSATVQTVLPAVETTETLSELLAQHGTVEVVRTNTADASFIARSVITYDGTVDPTPSAWTDAGLTISLDDTERGAVVEPDPAFPPPDSGTWQWDIISRGSNLTGGIVVEVSGASESSRVLRPFFASASDADDWFTDMFGWDVLSSSAATEDSVNEIEATWVPNTGTTEPDYDGAFTVDTTTERRSYRGQFSSSAYSLSAWNLWSDTIDDHLPNGGDRSDATFIRGAILTAVVLQETSDFWRADDDATYDNATPIDPVENRSATIPVLAMHGSAVGCGSITSGAWSEPRWRVHLLPTIGYDPQRTWEACGFHGSEEIIWTPLHPAAIGSETLYHFRVRGAEGLADGAPWTWSYGTASGRETEEPGSPTSVVPSGMTFWRVFAQVVKQSGDTTTKPGRPNCGPQPWKIRDHGWLADQVLAGGEAALGESWYTAKVNLYDLREVGGEAPGTLRDTEFEVGFQIRMAANTANQLSALVSGITHFRPCGWEQFVDGFDVELLFGVGGWEHGIAGADPSGVLLQPFGACHIYGSANPDLAALDDALDALGITRRTMECAELIAMRSDTYSLYEANPGGSYGWDVGTPTAPGYWSTMGTELEYCTLQDIEDAISQLGFTLNIAALTQRVSLESVVPGDDESVVDTLAADYPSYHVRQRVTRRELVAVTDPAGDYQLASMSRPHYFRIAPERPMRHQVMTREYVSTPPFGLACDIVKIDTITGPIQDALCRQRDYFRATGTDKDVFWAGTLLAVSGTTWSVIAVPWRDLMCDFSPDGSGPQSTIDTLENVPLVLPDNTARPTWLTVAEGDVVDVEALAGSAIPTWPDGHHTWELLILNRPAEAFES
jgi:hypothetical protein